MDVITQTNRTILFTEINPECLNLLTLIGDVRGKTSLDDDKIKEIKPTKSVLSSPATSLSHRLAITFTDRKILKSYIPLIISPVRQDEFIRQLLSVNPEIKH